MRPARVLCRLRWSIPLWLMLVGMAAQADSPPAPSASAPLNALTPFSELSASALSVSANASAGVAGADTAGAKAGTPSEADAPGSAAGGWHHQTLPGVARENRFALQRDPVSQQTVLTVDSHAAASTFVHPLRIDPAAQPWLSWRWQVSNPVAGSDFRHKAGDDYAARVYVLFDYPLDKLSFGDRFRISLAQNFSDVPIPTAAIAYVWGSAQAVGETGPNPYTDRVQMVVVDSGAAHVGEWRTHRRNVAEDFQRLFGEPAPAIIGIAVSADTDNTGEAVMTRFGDLRLDAE